MDKISKIRYAPQIALYPKQEKKEKIDKLKKALMIGSNSALLNRAIGELYEKTFTGEKWE